MEVGIGGLLFIGIPVVVVLVLVGLGLRQIQRRNDVVRGEALSPGVDTLRYHVPDGQDPAAVMAALETEGYRSTLAPAPAMHEVLIPCRRGGDRERAHVRAVIAHAAVDMEGQPGERSVVFADEPGGRRPL